MKTSKFSTEEIVSILKEGESSRQLKEVCRNHGISRSTFYKWKNKYGHMEPDEAGKMRDIELENRMLRRQLMQKESDIRMLKEVTAKKW